MKRVDGGVLRVAGDPSGVRWVSVRTTEWVRFSWCEPRVATHEIDFDGIVRWLREHSEPADD